MWRARAAATNPNGYPAYFRRHVVPLLKGIDGFQAALVVKRRKGRLIEFTILTKWSSMAAIKRFAGKNAEKARLEPGAVEHLTGFDRKVRHYEIDVEA